MAKIGDLSETKGEITMEWRIKEFSSLHQEIDKRYESPKFYFCGASWTIWLYPNGETKEESDEWLSLFIMRLSSGSPVTLDYSLGLKKSDGQTNFFVTGTNGFNAKGEGWGNEVIQQTVLMEKKSELLPTDILTVVCSLKNNEPYDFARSLFSRHQELSDNLKEIYEKGIRTDCILEVDGPTNIAAHRMILETRSPVFAAMFKHDTKEKETGEISIVDIDKSTIEDILEYVYSGDIKELNLEKALSVYAAAEKYDINNVREICSEFIIRNLSDGCVCDVIKFGELYQDEKIGFCAREYFKRNVRDIIKTDKWTTFAKENHDISMELFDNVVTNFGTQLDCQINVLEYFTISDPSIPNIFKKM